MCCSKGFRRALKVSKNLPEDSLNAWKLNTHHSYILGLFIYLIYLCSDMFLLISIFWTKKTRIDKTEMFSTDEHKELTMLERQTDTPTNGKPTNQRQPTSKTTRKPHRDTQTTRKPTPPPTDRHTLKRELPFHDIVYHLMPNTAVKYMFHCFTVRPLRSHESGH